MKPVARIDYELPSSAQWAALNEDLVREVPEELYWTVRAFGLEGLAHFQLAEARIPWYGFLLDLACGLAEWLQRPDQKKDFYPAEQAAPIRIRPAGDDVTFEIGLASGRVPARLAQAMVSTWLSALAKELQAKAPGVLEIPGFEWARDSPRS